MLKTGDTVHTIRVAYCAPEGSIKECVVDAFDLPKEWVHVGSIAGGIAEFKLPNSALTPV
jgi:hypothetical protein